MTENETKLLGMIKEFASGSDKAILKDALDELSENDSEKKFIAKLLSYIIIENNFLDDNSLFFKKIICEKFIEILEKKYYDNLSVFTSFLSVEDINFKKIMYFSILLSKELENRMPLNPLNILFLILINEYFGAIKSILRVLNITCFQNNKDLVYLILKNNLDDIDKEIDKKDRDIKKFLNLKNLNLDEHSDFINGKLNLNNILILSSINENDKNDKNEINEQQNLESNDNSKKNISTKLVEDINDIKINELKQERTIRIGKLINNSITIKENEKLKEDDKLNNNYNKIILNKEFNEKNIKIDDYEFKNNENLYLLSPISLLINDIKKDFELNDFEIFNKDNHYVELFGNYLKEIIIKLNDYINTGNEENYIIENKIKFGRYNDHFYLCCKLNEEFKDNYYNSINLFKNNIIGNEKNKETNKIKVIKKLEEEKKEEAPPKNISKNNKKPFSTYSAGKYSRNNYGHKKAYKLENDIRELIVHNKNNELQNLLFFFNLKIPKKNEEIEFESVTLFYNSFYDNLYGFREIDVCYKNNEEITLPTKIFDNNYSFVFQNEKFNNFNIEDIDVSIKKNKIIFCEIKSTFPLNITSGYENISKIKIKSNENNVDENNYSISFQDHVENLLKKSKIFYSFFENEGIEFSSMHILYIYDEFNISTEDNNNICNTVKECSKEIKFNRKFNTTIFQIVYFDNDEFKKKKKEKEMAEVKKEIVEKIQKENEENKRAFEKIQKENEENKQTIAKIQKENDENKQTIAKILKKSETNEDLKKLLEELNIIPK